MEEGKYEKQEVVIPFDGFIEEREKGTIYNVHKFIT
jgi:hypothetical protein